MTRALAFSAALLALIGGLAWSLTRVYSAAEVTPTAPNTDVIAPRLTQRALLIVIDGMRYDSAFESGAMPKLAALRARGASGVSLATDITMTGVGVRTIGTGVASGTYALARYWDLPPVDFDDVFAALHRRGDKIVVVGNGMWHKLFGRDIDVDDSFVRVTHLFHFVNPVYGADLLWVKRAKMRLAEPGWSLAVVHLGGLDNASHIYTPFGKRFYEKARGIDDDIAQLLEAAGPDTTVMITSDHGSSDTGHHGSGEMTARRSPLVIVGPGVVPGVALDANQVDLAPTLAVLLGLPRPAPAEGRVLEEALQLSDADRATLHAGELAQISRYATAYAKAHGVDVPTFRDVRELPLWLDRYRDTTRIAPVFWIAAATLLCVFVVVGRERPRLRAAGLFVVVLAVLESACVWWRLHYRFVTIKLDHVKHLLGRGYEPALYVLAVASIALVALTLRRASRPTSWTVLAALFTFSLFGDALTQGAAFVCGAAVLLERDTLRGAIVDVLLLALVAVTTHAYLLPNLSYSADIGVALLLLVALVQSRDPASLALVLAAAIAVEAVHHMSSPVWPFRSLWAVAGFLLIVGAMTRRFSVAIAIALAMSLFDLSRPQHVLGIVALTLLAMRGGTAVARVEDPRAQALRAALLIVALRMGFIALFEGELSISHIEVWLGYVGNPGQSWLYGTLVVVIKMWLPLVIALLLVGAHVADRSYVLLLVVTLFVFRVAHVIWWMTVARHTFYGPFVDVGALVFLLLFTLQSAILYAIGRRPR